MINPWLKYLLCLYACSIASFLPGQHTWKQAGVLCDRGEFAACLRTLDSCTDCRADSLLYLRAYAELKQNRVKNAESACRQLQRLNKDYYEVWFLKGLISAMGASYVQAAEQFTRVLNKNPHHIKALYNRALAKGLLEDYDGAIADLDTCIAVAPGYTAAYYSRGYWCESAMRYDQAISDYSHVILLDPSYQEAYLALAYVLNLKGDKQKACETLDLAIEKGSVAASDLKDNFCK